LEISTHCNLKAGFNQKGHKAPAYTEPFGFGNSNFFPGTDILTKDGHLTCDLDLWLFDLEHLDCIGSVIIGYELVVLSGPQTKSKSVVIIHGVITLAIITPSN